MNPLSDTFDHFVDDLISSDVNLLKGELDFLLMQDLFNSIDLSLINKNETKVDESLSSFSVLLMRFKSIELNNCCIRRKSSSPFNKLTSDESRSSTKSSKVSKRGFTIKNYF